MIKKRIIKNSATLFLILTILFYLLPNTSYSQGPNAIEASAFEAVDATDMVNLMTGDYTYVMPLLNVPSPEGGYPLTLSYHAGVGMDQEASWVGLGWSVNPGAITRGVNGYPDDWKNGQLSEGFYDVGGTEIRKTLSVSYTSITGQSIGASVSHSSSKGYGGTVSYGYGIPDGNGGLFGVSSSIGVKPGGQFYASGGGGYQSASGFSIGGQFSTEGISVNMGMGMGNDDGGVGLNVDSNSGLSMSLNKALSSRSSVGITLSSQGISIFAGEKGRSFGINYSFANSPNDGDYYVDRDKTGFVFPIPTPNGIVTIGYNKQKIKWWLNSSKVSNVSGILYFGSAVKYECQVTISFPSYWGSATSYKHIEYVNSPADCDCSNFSQNLILDASCVNATLLSPDPTNGENYFMDVNEIGTSGSHVALNANNAMFPAIDSYNVSAQGLSGSLTPKVSRNVALLGLSRDNDDTVPYRADYNLSNGSNFYNSNYNSPLDVNFYFKNQYSSPFVIEPSDFINNTSAETIFDYYLNGSGTTLNVSKKKDGSVVSFFTMKEMANGDATQKGLLLPFNYDFSTPENLYGFNYVDNPNINADAIGGFMVNAPDGKIYHYSLPVFQKNTSTRITGVIENKPERESYFETNQGSYATHWLLTAVTGPDYINGSPDTRKYPDVGDLGYWVRFDYGKWSSNNVWKSPYAEEYDLSEEDPNVKTKTYGRKELYYLDRIKTRTHTAIFVKNVREDNLSIGWERHAFEGAGAQPTSALFDQVRWTIPSQKTLRLEKVILVKNENDLIDKTSGASLAVSGSVFLNYVDGSSAPDYNLHMNVVDVYDNISETLSKAIKVIDFSPHYDYSLVSGTPNSASGRLTLNGVSFKGKEGIQSIPPYKFHYLNNRNFDKNKMDLWGYHDDDPKVWSLNKITMPSGSDINITFESDDYNLAAIETNQVITDKVGGGLRVKELSITDAGNNYKTRYSYNTPESNEDPSNVGYVSSGVISYHPFPKNSTETIPYGSELPAPIPMYEYVTVKNSFNDLTGNYIDKSIYKFKVLDQKDTNSIRFGDLFEISEQIIFSTVDYQKNLRVSARKFEIKDNLSSLGQILEIKRFNNMNHLLTKTVNNYAISSEISQGVIQESYETYKEVDFGESVLGVNWNINSSKRISYPPVLKSTTTTQGSYRSTTFFDTYDNISGQLLETRTYASDGTAFKTKTIPAYTKYPQMGSKVDNITNKNMLTQLAASYTYLLNEVNNTEKVIGAGITTWNNNWTYRDHSGLETTPINIVEKIWRKHKSFFWKGDIDSDGAYVGFNASNDDGFNWGIGATQTNSKWKQASEVKRYDHYSAPLEMMDINNNYASTKMCDGDSKILAVSNAKYTEMFYSGAEYLTPNNNLYFDGEVKSLGQSSVKAHTGKHSVMASTNQPVFEVNLKTGEHRAGKYKVSVWVDKINYANARININGSTKTFNGEQIIAGDWVLLN
ncbi:MAG: hypothetical protein CVU01_03765, partial [Bacteroidetes bacterium HGW-Bacteroidetes-18]